MVPQVPEASFFEASYASALRAVSGARPELNSACTANPVVSMDALSPVP